MDEKMDTQQVDPQKEQQEIPVVSPKKYWLLGGIFILILIFAGAGWYAYKGLSNKSEKPLTLPSEDEVRSSQIIVGSVGSVPDDDIKEFQPFIDYVARKLAPLGIKEGKVVEAKIPAEMAKLFRQNRADIYIDSPFPTYVVSNLSEGEVFLSRWKSGVEKYHSSIYVKKGSPIATLDDLKGKKIAFENSYSTSGYFLPKAELKKKGYTLVELKNPTDPVPKDQIGYFFSDDDKKIVGMVQSGLADAGAQNEFDFKKFAGDKYDQFTTIYQSRVLFRHIAIVRKGLDPKIKAALRSILLDMDKDPEGQAVLHKFHETSKFAEFDPEKDEAFAGIRELTDLVEEEIVRQ